MESKFVTNIANKAISNNVIDKEDMALYLYGLNKLLFSLIGLISSLLVGLALGMVTETIIFVTAYMNLRNYAGGYHAKSQIKCYIISILMIVLALMGVNYIYLFPKTYIGVLAISTIIIHKLAPIEAKNKPLKKMEVIEYRRKTITVLWILILISLLLLFLNLQIYAASIIVAIANVSIMLILGKYLT